MNDQRQDASKNMKCTLIKLERVKDRISLSKTTIYAWAALGLFPKPVSFGHGMSRWVEEEINAWIEARIKARDERAASAPNVLADGTEPFPKTLL